MFGNNRLLVVENPIKDISLISFGGDYPPEGANWIFRNVNGMCIYFVVVNVLTIECKLLFV